MKSDFHMHSLYSDGIFTPAQVYAHAAQAGVTHFALTDHDTTRGIDEMLAQVAQQEKVVFLPGIEVSCGGEGRTHMLFYGKVHCAPLEAWLEDKAAQRVERALKMAALLEQQGMKLSKEALSRLSQGNVGRPHIVRELLAAGYVKSYKQAFDLYLDEGKSCFVPHERPAAWELLDLFSGLPLVPVLAHPFKIGLGSEGNVLAFIESLIPHGLKGVEAYHPSADPRQARTLARFAEAHGLLITGGSDFHGEGEGHAGPGDTGSPWHSMEQDTCRLLEAVSRVYP